MCVTIPCRVIAVDGPFADVDRAGVRLPVNVATLDPPPEPGDWVAVQAQRYAVARLTPEEAREALALIAIILDAAQDDAARDDASRNETAGPRPVAERAA